MSLLSLVLAAALAQDANTAVPDLDAQHFRPSIDGQSTLWTDDSGTTYDPTFSAGVLVGYALNPLVYVGSDDTLVRQVSDLVHLDLVGAVRWKPLRFGVHLPIHTAFSTADSTRAGLGDLNLDLRGTVLRQRTSGIGLAFAGKLTLPTNTLAAPVGTARVGYELSAIVDRRFGPLLLAMNVGHRGVPEVDLGNGVWGDAIFARLGAGYDVTDDLTLSGELVGSTPYAGSFANPLVSPLELLAGAHWRMNESFVLKGGLGTGLSPGVSSPNLRLMAGVAFHPETDASRLLDTDKDGPSDFEDPCPEDPEDVDGWQDEDGCPDPSTALTIRLVDPNGELVPGSVRLSGTPGDARGQAGDVMPLHPGTYRLNAEAVGYTPIEKGFEVAAVAIQEKDLVIQPVAGLGTIAISVRDSAGNPVAATWSVDGAKPRPVDGNADGRFMEGTHDIIVTAEGFATTRLIAPVDAGATTRLDAELEPARVVIQGQKLYILEKVFFETDSATILDRSHPLLNEVAATLHAHLEILKVRVEGHTDTRGSAEYNLELSDKRAAEVMAFLIAEGIDPARLISEGYGESTPIDAGDDHDAWARNRRVEFIILEQRQE